MKNHKYLSTENYANGKWGGWVKVKVGQGEKYSSRLDLVQNNIYLDIIMWIFDIHLSKNCDMTITWENNGEER